MICAVAIKLCLAAALADGTHPDRAGLVPPAGVPPATVAHVNELHARILASARKGLASYQRLRKRYEQRTDRDYSDSIRLLKEVEERTARRIAELERGPLWPAPRPAPRPAQ